MLLPVWFTFPLRQRSAALFLLLVPLIGLWGAWLLSVVTTADVIHSRGVDFLWRAISVAAATLGGAVASQMLEIQKMSTCSVLPNARRRHLTYIAWFAALPPVIAFLLLLPHLGVTAAVGGAAVALTCFALAAVSTDSPLPESWGWAAAFLPLLFFLIGAQVVQRTVTDAPWLAAVPMLLSTAALIRAQLSASHSCERSLYGHESAARKANVQGAHSARTDRWQRNHAFIEPGAIARITVRDWVRAVDSERGRRAARTFLGSFAVILLINAALYGLVSGRLEAALGFTYLFALLMTGLGALGRQDPALRGIPEFPPRTQRAQMEFMLSLRASVLFAASALAALLCIFSFLSLAQSFVVIPPVFAFPRATMQEALWVLAGMVIAAPASQFIGVVPPSWYEMMSHRAEMSMLRLLRAVGLTALFVITTFAAALPLRILAQHQPSPVIGITWLGMLLTSQAIYFRVLKRHYAKADLI